MKTIGESTSNNGNTNWSTKDKLYLASSVLVNGDQNWSLISEQLNKIRDYEHKQKEDDDDDDSTSFYSYSLSDCSKQYKSLLSNYGDAKKIYNALTKERLKELDENLKNTSKEYDDLYKEIELVLSGALDSQLIESTKRPGDSIENIENNKKNSDGGDLSNKNGVNTENSENTQPSIQNKSQMQTRKGSITAAAAKPVIKINDNEFTIVREKRHSNTKKQSDVESETQKMDIDKSKFSSEDEDDLSDVADDDNGGNSHKSSSSSTENIEYLTWKPEISTATESTSVEDELNRSTGSLKKQTLSSSFDKRSSIEWKPVIDNTTTIEKPIVSKTLDKSVKTSKQDVGLRITRVSSSSDRLKQSSLVEQTPTNAAVVKELINLAEDEKAQQKEVTVKIECTDEDDAATKKSSQVNENMDVSSPVEVLEASKDAENEKVELIFAPKITHDESTESNKNEVVSAPPAEIKPERGRVGRPRQAAQKQETTSSPLLRVRSLRNADRNKAQAVAAAASSEGGDSKSNNDNEKDLASGSESATTEEIQATSQSTTILSIKNEPHVINVGGDDKNENQENTAPRFEDEKAYKAWKKSITMMLSNITSHKHATVFMHPVRDEIAPGYRNVVYRPMDLSTIKKNIENGSIKTTKEFQRDIMLMFTNAIMYNSSNHDVYKIGLEMYKEVMHTIEQLLDAQENTLNDNKPLRFKDSRNSTNSDKDNEQDNSDVANLLSNKSSLTITQQASTDSAQHKTSIDGDMMETASNSNSSISATNNNSNKKRRVSSTEQVKLMPKRRKR